MCEVEYLEITKSTKKMRAPSFKGLRDDKTPENASSSPRAGADRRSDADGEADSQVPDTLRTSTYRSSSLVNGRVTAVDPTEVE